MGFDIQLNLRVQSVPFPVFIGLLISAAVVDSGGLGMRLLYGSPD